MRTVAFAETCMMALRFPSDQEHGSGTTHGQLYQARVSITTRMSSSVRQPLRTLLVDDEPLILQILSDTLQDTGHEVGTASNGEQGLARFQEAEWDVVVTDRAMPVVNGEQMAASIKLIHPQTPIILITGMANAACDASLFAVILQKPFRACHLLNAIEGCVAKPFCLQAVTSPQ